MFIAGAMCGFKSVTVAALLCSNCSLLRIWNSNWATENEAGRSVSVNGNEEPSWRELSPIQFSCNCGYSLITHNETPVHSTWGLLRVCAACPTPRLNLSSELRPSWNNIQDTFSHRLLPAGYNTCPCDKATVTCDPPPHPSLHFLLHLAHQGFFIGWLTPYYANDLSAPLSVAFRPEFVVRRGKVWFKIFSRCHWEWLEQRRW